MGRSSGQSSKGTKKRSKSSKGGMSGKGGKSIKGGRPSAEQVEESATSPASHPDASLVKKMRSSQLADVESFFDAVDAGVEITKDDEADGATLESGLGSESSADDSDDGDVSSDSGNEDSSDQENDGRADGPDDAADSGEALRRQIAKHKQQLAALKKSDPEFYEFMQQEGSEELGFGADVDTADLDETELIEEGNEDNEGPSEDDFGDDSDDEGGRLDESAEEASERNDSTAILRAQRGKKHLSMSTLERWIEDAKGAPPPGDGSESEDEDTVSRRPGGKKQLAAVQQLLRAFDAAAVLLGDIPQPKSAKGKKDAALAASAREKANKAALTAVRRCKYKMESGAVFDALLVCVTREIPTILLDDVLGRPSPAIDEEGNAIRSKQWRVQTSKRWAAMSKVIARYCQNMLKLLQIVTETEMTSWVLRAIMQALPLILATPQLARQLLKITLTLWATGEETVRARAFFVIRGLATSQPKKLLPLAMKGTYLSYIRHTKTSNPTALPRINFFVACITDLFGLDMQLAYEHTFLSIRQLAVTLRNTLTGKTAATANTVCCWPFVNALRCWGQVLAQYPRQSELGLLIYPYTQVVFGTIKLASTSASCPMRFLLLRFLINVAAATDIYIPVAPFLLEILDGAELKAGGRKDKSATAKPPPLEHVLRVSKQMLHSRPYQAKIVSTVCELLLQSFGPLANAVAFPELALPAIRQLKAFGKQTKVSQFRKFALTAAGHLTRNVAWAEKRREDAQLALLAPDRSTGIVPLRELENVQGKGSGKSAREQSPLMLFLRQQLAVDKVHAAQQATVESELNVDGIAGDSDEEEQEVTVQHKRKKRRRTDQETVSEPSHPQLMDESELMALEDEVLEADEDDL